MFFNSMTVCLNAAYHGWAVKKMFNSGCSKTGIFAFLKPLENLLKPSSRKIIKTLFKTSLTSGCFLCFISFTNRAFCLTRRKFPTSGRYFHPCNMFSRLQFTIHCIIHLVCAQKFPKNRYFSPWYPHLHTCIRGGKCLFLGNFWRTC